MQCHLNFEVCVTIAAMGCLATYKISVQSSGWFLRYEKEVCTRARAVSHPV